MSDVLWEMEFSSIMTNFISFTLSSLQVQRLPRPFLLPTPALLSPRFLPEAYAPALLQVSTRPLLPQAHPA